ncbi:Small-conductance mechanosensitive channel [Luteibacter sp. UNCMF366Tsu5.1]|nr:Small-conductance mechanosensitive channel [Luteibacter sp. UNCMF366Tsu5.1]
MARLTLVVPAFDDPPMRILRIFFVALLLAGSGATFAQADDASPSPAQQIDDLRGQLDQIEKAMKDDKITDAALDDLRSKSSDVASQAQKVSTTLQPTRDAAKARLDQLGPPPAAGTKEAPELAATRKDAKKAFDAVDAQIKQVDGLALEAQQTANQLADLRRIRFQETISRRTNSPLSRPFWSEPAAAFPRDSANLREFAQTVQSDVANSWTNGNRTALIACVVMGLLLMTGVRFYIEHRVRHLTANRMPPGRLRRSALILGIALTSTLTTGLGTQLFYLGLNWNDTFSQETDGVALAIVHLVFFGAFVAGLGRALISAKRPSWRLPAIPDETAMALRRFPMLISLAVVLFYFLKILNHTIGTSLAATVLTSSLQAIVLTVLTALALQRLGRTHHHDEDGTPPPPRPIWASLFIAAAWIAIVASWIGLLTGFIAFASFVAGQVVWTTIVVAATYLAMRLVDDLFETLLSEKGPMSARAQAIFGTHPKLLDQAGVLLSGVVRLGLFLFGLTAVLSGFGAGAADILVIGSKLQSFKIYDVELKPSQILSSIALFFLGLVAVRVIKSWMAEQYLPRTSLDPGMRSSLTTLLGYVGVVVVVAIALLAMGLSVQNVAWVASALSVGIGFGLQAIVQNFVSGLILLAERPVKVGDWVVLDDAEGDVRRINVRATEIQVADRSTIIVPNSSFITKPVRNMTMANPQGRVLFKLPMPLDSDPVDVREHMLEAMRAHASVQENPAPLVMLDNVDRTAMTFMAICYVGSPRDAGGVKSDLLFDILARLRGAEIPLLRPQDLVLRTGGGAPELTGPTAAGAPKSATDPDTSN